MPTIPTISKLIQENITSEHIQSSIIETATPATGDDMHADVLISKDKLFFITYTVSGKMKRRRYLINVDFEASEQSCTKFSTTGLYYRLFGISIQETLLQIASFLGTEYFLDRLLIQTPINTSNGRTALNFLTLTLFLLVLLTLKQYHRLIAPDLI